MKETYSDLIGITVYYNPKSSCKHLYIHNSSNKEKSAITEYVCNRLLSKYNILLKINELRFGSNYFDSKEIRLNKSKTKPNGWEKIVFAHITKIAVDTLIEDFDRIL